MEPKLTVSGYRGVWGESLTEQIVENYTKAFIVFIKENISDNPTILVGRDGRESGPIIRATIIQVFNNMKINFVDGDILPTPTVLLAVRKHQYDGAIIITASHNPREYNGLKFVTNKALFTNEEEVGKIKSNYEKIKKNNKFSFGSLFSSARIFSGWKISLLAPSRCAELPKTTNSQSNLTTENISNIPFPKEHADQIIKNINVEKIRARKFKVAVDMINASACVLDPYLFEQLGVELVPLNNIPNGIFAHKPEPLRENLGDITDLVTKEKCDLGFAHDPDADRLIVINEEGVAISEEYTLALGVEAILSKNKNQKVVINMSTSQMNNDIAEKYGGRCLRTKVGEANVVTGIMENNAIIGGEGGGGIIYPTINMARDSFVSLSLILELLAERNQTVSQCLETLPQYEMKKDKVPVSGTLGEMYAKMKNHFKGGLINELDGLRFDFPDCSWIHLRPSNTEPIVRLYGEAKTKERIEGLFKETHTLLA